MDREKVKKLLPILQAYAEGKRIELKDSRGFWWTHFDPIEELEEYYGQDGEPKQKSPTSEQERERAEIIAELKAEIDVYITKHRLSRLRQTDRVNFERIILENIQFLDEGDVVEYLDTATLTNELLYRERKERLDKAKEK